MAEKLENAIPLRDLVGQEIQAHFVRSSQFRIVYVEGAWGGLTPRGNIQMALFSDRTPHPDSIVYEVQEGGVLKEERTPGPPSVERVIEADIVMPLDVAIVIRNWLTDKIELAQQVQQRVQQRQSESGEG